MAQRHGLRLLYEGEGAVADIVFVHGLFGHPKDSWTTTPTDGQAAQLSTMNGVSTEAAPAKASTRKHLHWNFWRKHTGSTHQPRRSHGEDTAPAEGRDIGWTKAKTLFWPEELLPQDVRQSRIYTWGYDVDINHIFSSAGQATTFQHAQSLLLDLGNERISAEDKNRKIIFVAHSLGGIVVKDMLNASRNEITYLKEILPQTYGIIFLGTPHRGSDMASLGKMAQDITRIFLKHPNTTILQDLEVNAQTLERIGRGFSQILEERPIQIYSFREEFRTKGVMVVNPFSSAIDNGREITSSIPADHEHMARFSGSKDPGYLRVSSVLKRWCNEIKQQEHVTSDSLPNLSYAEMECVRTLRVEGHASQRQRIPPRLSGTCRWFLGSPLYEKWRQEQKSSLLWVSADPGCGKSVLASFLVDELQSAESQSILPSTICYFFCKADDDMQNQGHLVLCGLLHQLLSTRTNLVKYAQDVYKTRGPPMTHEPETLWSLLTDAVSNNGNIRVVCVIDALDECTEPSQKLLVDLIAEYFSSRKAETNKRSFLKVLITSRPESSIQQGFKGCPEIRFKGEEHVDELASDIALVIKDEIKKLPLNSALASELEVTLIEKADRTFLWVSLILQLVKDEADSPEDVKTLLQDLPKGLDAVYDRILGPFLNLSTMEERFRNKKWKILYLIVAAARPLTLEEINWALTIGAGDASEGLVKKNLHFDVEQTIKKHCGCFLRIIEAKVYFVHLTAMEFLTRSNQISIPPSGSWKASIDPVESNVLLSTICVTYLSMHDFRQNPLQAFNYQGSWTYGEREEEKRKHLDNYTKYHPFLDYASKYWAQHFRTAEAVSSQLLPNPELICEAGSPIFLTWLPIFWPSTFRTNPPKFTTLAICSYFGFETVVRRLLVRKNIEVNAKVEEDGGTALHWAARHGNEVVVRLLLERGADVDAKDDGGKTALHWAASSGREAVVRLLLERGADVDAKDDGGKTALHWAASYGHEAVVRLLLERGADVDAKDKYGWSVLHQAASYGHEAVVRLLQSTTHDIADHPAHHHNA